MVMHGMGPDRLGSVSVGLLRSYHLAEIRRRTHLPNQIRLALPCPAYHSRPWLGSERESAGIKPVSLSIKQSVNRRGRLSGSALSLPE